MFTTLSEKVSPLVQTLIEHNVDFLCVESIML